MGGGKGRQKRACFSQKTADRAKFCRQAAVFWDFSENELFGVFSGFGRRSSGVRRGFSGRQPWALGVQTARQPGSQPVSLSGSQATRQAASQATRQPAWQPGCLLACQPARQPGSQAACMHACLPASQASSQASRQPGKQAAARQPGSQAARHPASQPASQASSQAARHPGSQASRPSSQSARQPIIPVIQPVRQRCDPVSQNVVIQSARPICRVMSQSASQWVRPSVSLRVLFGQMCGSGSWVGSVSCMFCPVRCMAMYSQVYGQSVGLLNQLYVLSSQVYGQCVSGQPGVCSVQSVVWSVSDWSSRCMSYSVRCLVIQVFGQSVACVVGAGVWSVS